MGYAGMETSLRPFFGHCMYRMCACMYVYVYIYIRAHTHTCCVCVCVLVFLFLFGFLFSEAAFGLDSGFRCDVEEQFVSSSYLMLVVLTWFGFEF